jgi:NADH:ubiquinone oxidoreductase subunit F (NADH-binding)/NADH:ubiquinone oxidoreductase subunit E
MEIKRARARLIYEEDMNLPIRKSHENPAVKDLYKIFLHQPLGHQSHHLLHTTYTPKEAEASPLLKTAEAEEIKAFLHSHPKFRSGLTNTLIDVADKYGGLSDVAVSAVAHHIGTTPGLLDAIVSHYHFLPRVAEAKQLPETCIYLCDCASCRLHGSESIKHTLEAKFGHLSKIHVQTVSWLGWCVNGAPAALIKHKGSSKVHQLLHLKPNDSRLSLEFLEGLNAPVPTDSKNTTFKVVPGNVPDISILTSRDSIQTISQKIFSMTPEAVIDEIKASGLRGCGGGGFPVYFKWKAVRAEQADAKYVVINADEGLPCTFKDLHLLQDPGCRMRMIMGACLGATVVGAKDVYLYLRYEYRNLKGPIEEMWHTFTNLVNPQCRSLNLTIVLGAGPYICGEETALFESIEGHLPQARTHRHIYPTHHGLFGKPTLIGNVESFCWVVPIVTKGGATFAAAGQNGQQGMKLFSISGNVAGPILGEFPMGIKLKDLLQEVCEYPVNEVAAVEVGGAHAALESAPFDKILALDFKEDHLAASGSIVVYRKGHTFNEAAIYEAKAQFGEAESCQLCAPCRDGTRIMRQTMSAMHAGILPPDQQARMRELVGAMEVSSNCGHGKAFGKLGLDVLDRAYPKKKA